MVPLQPEGRQQPVFVFPSSHSDPAMRSDAEIARELGRERPVWGLAHQEVHRDLVRRAGVAALGAEYVAQIRALQPAGPYLLFGNCMGGHLAWETASQLLAQGAHVSDICFFEVPLRADFANVRSGPIPVEATNVWRLGHYYAPAALPVRLTHIMTPQWYGARWWLPWQDLALGGMDVVLLAEDDVRPRAERMAEAIRAWCLVAEASRTA
jgi:hypothetical protein